MGLPTIALKKPVMAVMIFSAFVLLGLISLLRLPIELYQGQNQGIVSIIVRARGGLAPSEVEKSITKPIEESVATVSNLKELYSSSREAESRVTMAFQTGTDMRFAALEVREKFSRVKPLLPKEIEKPVIANYDDNDTSILVFALTSNSLAPEEIREIVETELKPILNRVDGVASVEVYGGRERKILIETDRDKMVNYNVSMERIMDLIGQSNVNLLAGNVGKGKMDLGIRTKGAFEKVEDIGEIGIKATRQRSIIPLKEVATVKDSFMEASDAARLNLEQNVTVYVKKTSMANTIPVVKTVRRLLDDFKYAHAGSFDVIIVQDKAQTILRAIKDVWASLITGMVLILFVIYLFLRNWILAGIVFLSMPISVIITFFCMSAMGISINIMTLSGLALAIGVLVDSSVVIIENIFTKKQKKVPDFRAIREGSEEVWIPLLGSLATSLIVFLPIVFIDKKIQMLYSGFAFTVSASLVGSFFIALMLIPIAMRRFASGNFDTQNANDKWFAKIQNGYRWMMEKNLKARYSVVLAMIGVLAFSTWQLTRRPVDWPSAYEENEFSVIVFPLAGARLEANDDSVKKVEELLSKIPDIEMYSSTVRKDDIRVFVRLKPKGHRQFSKDEIIHLIDQKGNEMVKETHDDYSLIVDEGVGASEQKKLIINIFGHDNDQLQKLAVEAANRLSKVDGFQNIVMTDLRKRPEYSLIVDKGRAAYFGLSVQKIADSIHAQVRGMRPTKFHELTKGEEIETITRLQAIYRQKIDDLRYIPVETDSGKQVLLGEVANFYPSTGPQTIDRKDKYRYVFVKGDTKKPIEQVANAAAQIMKEMEFPDDYYWRFGGSYEELVGSKSELAVALLLTICLVYMTLAVIFENYGQPFLIMLSVPMCTIGVWLGLVLTHKPLSQQVFIGMILLAGYVVNSAIIMVDHINHLKQQGHPEGQELLIRAGLDRLRPIAMTTLSTVLGFLPMALGWSQSADLWAPLAITVIGGLLSSTVLTLFVLPNFIMISKEMDKFLLFIGQLLMRCLGGLLSLFHIKVKNP